MFLFFLGAILGCSLGIVFLALLMKSKETDESAYEVLREAPIMVEKNLVTSR
jgi:predicted small secreted protein